jgi:hypothetical protein
MHDTIQQATPRQVKFLLHLSILLTVRATMGIADGATVITLSKRNLIEPAGRSEGRRRWRLRVQFTDDEIDLMRQIVER